MATPTTTKIDIPLILGILAPSAEYHWKGDGWGVYADIGAWRSPAIPQPSESEIYVAWDAYLISSAAEAANAANDTAKVTSARVNAKSIPNWATWNEAQTLAWIAGKFDATTISNITTLAQAKPVMNDMATAITALARMVIALRDHTWPDLDR